MADLENILKNQESDLARDQEIARVLECCPRDYFAILQINPLVGLEDLAQKLRKAYRRKSLLIHPDKTQNERAPRAFALLKKAEHVLAIDETQDHENEDLQAEALEKKSLIDIYKHVDERLQLSLQEDFDHKDNKKLREEVQQLLESHSKNQEIERSFAQRQDLQRQEAIKTAAKERELKKSWEQRWEQDRGDRVKLWRAFTSKVEKPKKKKKKVLA